MSTISGRGARAAHASAEHYRPYPGRHLFGGLLGYVRMRLLPMSWARPWLHRWLLRSPFYPAPGAIISSHFLRNAARVWVVVHSLGYPILVHDARHGRCPLLLGMAPRAYDGGVKTALKLAAIRPRRPDGV